MDKVSKTDLIFNKDGSIYHLGLQREHIADDVIMVGDPGRVEQVSKYFHSIDWKSNKREFVCHTGVHNSKKITVLSTGIGVDNVEIAMTEIDALLNIDPETMQVKTSTHSVNFIRVGTSGALQKDIPVDSFIVSKYGLGLDNLMKFYDFQNDNEEAMLLEDIIKKVNLHVEPYLAKGSDLLLDKYVDHMISGATITSPGFYAPQGRRLRVPTRPRNLLEELRNYKNDDFRFLNFEMETAALYALARLMGHQAISLNVILANRATRDLSPDPMVATDRLIRKALEVL